MEKFTLITSTGRIIDIDYRDFIKFAEDEYIVSIIPNVESNERE
jgi:hypothetical protein